VNGGWEGRRGRAYEWQPRSLTPSGSLHTLARDLPGVSEGSIAIRQARIRGEGQAAANCGTAGVRSHGW
jgi:hypothetical protein